MNPAPRFLPVCFGLLLHAVLPDAAAASPYFDELPTVLTASRLHQPVKWVPGAVTVIDRALIEATGYRELPRLLRLVAGMQVGQERGHAHWVTYHGLSNDFPTEMQVLVDGRSVISPGAFGGVDWSALPVTLDEIERIEVVRGTNANSFGANAFLGVLNIITRPADEPGGNRVGVRGGTAGVRDVTLSLGAAGEPAALRVNAAWQQDDGFAGLHDARRGGVLSLRSDLRLSNTDTLMLRLGASRAERGEGYAGSLFDNNGLRDSHGRADSLHLQWRHSASAGDEWLLSYYRNHERIRDRWFAHGPGFPDVPLQRDRESRRDSLEIQRLAQLSDTLQWVWGAETRRDAVHAPFLFDGGDPPAQSLHRLFANAEWRAAQRLVLNYGAVLEKYSTARSRVSPRLHANYFVTPAHTLRAGYARAWRQHNLFELYGDVVARDPASGAVLVRPFLPNPGLRQARVDTLELGYHGTLATWRSTLDVRVFDERIRDFVLRVPQPDPLPAPLLSGALGSTRYENLDRTVRLRGIEYQLEAQPVPGTRLRLAHMLARRSSGEPQVDDRSAPYVASASWLQDYGGGWHSMLTVLRMGALAGGDGFVPAFDYRARPYTAVDASLRYRGRTAGGQRYEWSLTALNLGPRHQETLDRAQQATSPDEPVNRVSRQIYLGLVLGLD